MAPIFTPDGAEVSEVILPDGASASAVIAPDGSAVFSAIPDSDLTQYTVTQLDAASLSVSSASAYSVGDIGANDRDRIYKQYAGKLSPFRISFTLDVTSATADNAHFHIGIATNADETFQTASDWVGLHTHDAGDASIFSGNDFASRVGAGKDYDDVEEIFASYVEGTPSNIEMDFDINVGEATLRVTSSSGSTGNSTVSFDETKEWDTVYALMGSERNFGGSGAIDATVTNWAFESL